MSLDSAAHAVDASDDWLRPCFSAPSVRALMSTRRGGASAAPFDQLNLRPGLGDDPDAVAENRRRLRAALGVPTQRVDQVHGVQVAVIGPHPLDNAGLPTADASITTAIGLACEIQVADCLPVLFAHRDGRVVGAAHAGWRGLAGGVLEATVANLLAAAGGRADDIEAWLGPCIGPRQFEVGRDVVEAFSAAPDAGARFTPHREGKWLADLAGLARDRLRVAGLVSVMGNDGGACWCTVENPSRFFSFRRDRVTGRMAACIWRVA